jgi:hypothetical protein
MLKTAALQTRRAATDVRRGIRRHPAATELWPYTLAEARSPLWSEFNGDDDSTAEHRLQAGKVQNLRGAAHALHGVTVPAGEVLSFWKQVGRATRRRGFTEGRLLREGCFLPAIGGGLCQMSNTLYDAALNAGVEVVERWAHSRVVPGSAAMRGRDATVAWNYIDLRFRAAFDWQLEVRLTAQELIVRFRTAQPHQAQPLVPFGALQLSASATRPAIDVREHSCHSCDAGDCFRHRDQPSISGQTFGNTYFLVDEAWPEFQEYVAAQHTSSDGIALPRTGAWQTDDFAAVRQAAWQSWRRSLTTRRLGHYGARRLQEQLLSNDRIAAELAGQLPPDATHLVVASSFLAALWEQGVLGGRTFDVLMTRLPLYALQDILDTAYRQYPERATLGEFRAASHIVAAERAALQAARRIVTPHAAVAALFPERAYKLAWQPPRVAAVSRGEGNTLADLKIVFPGPTAARKGAYAVREAATALNATVLALGSELEGEDFWQDVKIQRVEDRLAEDWLEVADVVVQPAIVEERPRLLLCALAAGLPVVASTACGLDPHPLLTIVPADNPAALVEAIRGLQM